jgi:hypothetical protein
MNFTTQLQHGYNMVWCPGGASVLPHILTFTCYYLQEVIGSSKGRYMASRHLLCQKCIFGLTHNSSLFSSGWSRKLSGRRDTISPAACQPSYSCTGGLDPYIEPVGSLHVWSSLYLTIDLRNSMLTAPDRAPYVVLGMLLSACQWSLSLADTSLIHLLVHIFFTWLSYMHSWSSSSIVIVLGFKSESSVGHFFRLSVNWLLDS